MQNSNNMGGASPYFNIPSGGPSQLNMQQTGDFDFQNDMVYTDSFDSTFDTDATSTQLEYTQNVDNLFTNQSQFYQTPQQPQFLQPPARPQSVVPMQPSYLAVPMPPQGHPNAQYHPAVGWFYPLQVVPPQMPIPVPQPGQKRKQGPFVGDINDEPQQPTQSRSDKRRKTQRSPSPIPDTHVISDDDNDDDYKQAPARRKYTRKAPAPRSPTMAQKIPSVAQACVCGTAKEHIPRPRNAFILYRQQMLKTIVRDVHTSSGSPSRKLDQGRVSALAGERWKNETEDVRAHFHRLAAQEAANHAVKYPGYKYKPKRKQEGLQDERFGTMECTCGAYRANVLKARAAGFEINDNVPSEDGYAAVPKDPSTSHQAAAAQMAQPEPEREPTYIGLPVGRPADLVALAPTRPGGLALPGVRRTSRTHNAISYAEPADTPDDHEDDIDARLSEALAAPSPQMEGKEKRRPSAISTPFNSPPAANTRSKSLSRESINLGLPSIAEGEMADFDWDLFDGDFDARDDTIEVAGSRRRSSARAASSNNSSRKGSKNSPKTSATRRTSPRTSPRNSGSPKGVEKRRAFTTGPRRSPRRSN